MPQVKITLDREADLSVATPGFPVGQTIQFDDAIPTIDEGVAFYISQLGALESKVYAAKYANITFMEDVPVKTDVPEYADEWDYIGYDAVTIGKFIGASAEDLPNVQLSANKTSVPIGYAGLQYSYSLEELRKSSRVGIPVDSTKATIAFRGSQEHAQRVAYFGDTDRNMTGLFNNANLAVDDTDVDFATATGEEMADAVLSFLSAVWENSKGVHLPDTLRIASKRYTALARKKMTDYTDKTVLQYIKEENLYTQMTGGELDIKPRFQLEGVGVGDTDRMLAYEKNDENLAMAQPIPFRPLAPQPLGLNVNVPCEYKISGTEFRFPFSGAYRDFSVNLA